MVARRSLDLVSFYIQQESLLLIKSYCADGFTEPDPKDRLDREKLVRIDRSRIHSKD